MTDNDQTTVGSAGTSQDWHLHAVLAAVVGWIGMNAGLAWTLGDSFEKLSLVVRLWLSLLPIHGAALAGILIVLFRRIKPGRRLDALNLRWPVKSWLTIIRTAGVTALLFYPFSVLLNQLSTITLQWLGFDPSPPPMSVFLQELDNPLLLLSLVAAAVVIAPLVEEALFRLVLFEALRPVGVAGAAVVASAAFAMLHGTLVQAPALFILGLLLQKIRHRHGTLWASIILHAGFNAISITLVWVLVNFFSGRAAPL